MTDEIELNQDGTAHCDFCKQDKPAEGFRIGTLFHGTYYDPPEYGQQCKDCHDKELEMDRAMSEAMEQ
jgi:hypothetical protein